MHDRRVGEQALTFGNQGALFMNAMTWWDHGSNSIWSQPWGTAIAGPLKGTTLTLIPASIVPWSTWLAEHPDSTLVADGLGGFFSRAEGVRDDFVIGVALEDSATAYPYRLASQLRVINDWIGKYPVAVFADPATRDIKVYLRRPGLALQSGSAPLELHFKMGNGAILDEETGSTWDVGRGVATGGPLNEALLQQIPYVTSFDWAWLDFFPHTAFYGPE